MSLQAAAIPYRLDAAGEPSVLLVTSRTKRRWILPKGNARLRMLARRTAAREAFEEAGVTGHVAQKPFAIYTRSSRTSDTDGAIEITAYPLEVTEQLITWPEMNQRDRRWFALPEAQHAVHRAELRELLRRFEQWLSLKH